MRITSVRYSGFACLCFAIVCPVLRATPFSEGVQLLKNSYVVVEESALEPRSIGSYSIRLYDLTTPDFPTDNFVSGIIRVREGTIQSIEKVDVNSDGEEDLVVLIRSAGSGGYLQIEAFQCSDKKIEVLASELGLDPETQYLQKLKTIVD